MSNQQPQAQTSNLAEALVASGLVKNVKIPQPDHVTNSTNYITEQTNSYIPAPIISAPNHPAQVKTKRAQSNIDFVSVTSQRGSNQIKLSPIENIYVDRQANAPLPKLKLKPEGPSIRSDAPISDLSFFYDKPQKKESTELTNEEILRSIPSNEPITFPRTMLLATSLGKPQVASRANYENLNSLLQHLVSQIELDPNSTDEEKIVAQRDAFNTVMSEIVRQGFYECSEKGDLFNNMRTYMNQTADQIPVLTNKLQKVREAAQNQIAALKSENDDLEKKNEALFAKFNSLEKDQNRLQSRLKFAEEKIPQLEENTRILRLKNQESEIKVSETLKKLEKVKQKKAKLKTTKVENQSIIEEMGKKAQDLLDYKEKAQDTIFLLTDENERLKKINIELKKEIETLKEATNELSKKLEEALKESKRSSDRVNEQTQTGFFSKQSNYGSRYNNGNGGNSNNSGGGNTSGTSAARNMERGRSRNQLSYTSNIESDTDDSDSDEYYSYYEDEDEMEKEKSNRTTATIIATVTASGSKESSAKESPKKARSRGKEANEIRKTSSHKKKKNESKEKDEITNNKQKEDDNKSATKTATKDNKSASKSPTKTSKTSPTKNSNSSNENENENEKEEENENESDAKSDTKIETVSPSNDKDDKEDEDDNQENEKNDNESNDSNDNESANNEDSTVSKPSHKKRRKHKNKEKPVATVQEIKKLKKDYDACQDYIGDITLDSFKKLKETILARNGRFVPNNENLMKAQDGNFDIIREDESQPPSEGFQDALKMFVHSLMNRVMDKSCNTVLHATIGIQMSEIESEQEGAKTPGLVLDGSCAGGGFGGLVSTTRIMLVDRETMCFQHELMRDEFKDNFTRLLDPTYSDRPPRSFEWLMKSIKSIYDEKTLKDVKDFRDVKSDSPSLFKAMSMPLFALQWSMRQYGLEYLAHQCCWDLVNTARAHQSKAADVEMFRKFLDEDYSTSQLTFFLRMRTVCMRRGITLPVNVFVDDNGDDEKDSEGGKSNNSVVYNQVFLTTSIAIEIIQKVFQKAGQEAIDATVRAVRHDVVRKPSPTADSSVTYVSMISVLSHSIEAFQTFELNELRKLMLCCQIKPKLDGKSFRQLVRELIPSANDSNVAELYRLLLSSPSDPNGSPEKVHLSKKKFVEKFNERSLLNRKNTEEAFEIEKYYSSSPEFENVKEKWKSLMPIFDDALEDAGKRERDPSLSHEMQCLKLDIDNVNTSLTCFDVFGAHKNILSCLIQYQELIWTFNEPEIESMDETTNSIMSILKI